MGVFSAIVDKVMAELGITQSMVEKGKELISSVDIDTQGDKTVFTINLKKIVITIEK